MRFLLSLLFCLMIVSFACAQDFTVKPFQETLALQKFRSVLDTVTSEESQMKVAGDFQRQFPDQIPVQMYASNMLIAKDPVNVRNHYKFRADGDLNNMASQFLAGRLMEDSKARAVYAERILKVEPNNYWGYMLQATAYTDADDPGMNKAEADLRKAISIDNSLPYAVEQLGNLLQQRGDNAGADKVYAKLAEMQPSSFAPLQYRLMLVGNDHKKAIALLDEFLKKNPSDLNALNAKARSQREISDWKGYVATNQQAVQAILNGETAYNLACSFSLNGQKDSAFVWLTTATDSGFTDLEQYKADDDLIPLRDDPRWSDLLNRVDKNQKAELANYLKQAAATAPQRKEKALNERLSMTAPDFTLSDFSDKKISLADLKGKVVVLDFWATWCGPCKMTMPLLDKFYTSKAEGVEVYGINVWERQGTTNEKIKAFIKDKGFKFPVLFGSTELASAYQVQGIPTLFVIDKEGKIAYRHVGYNPTIPETLDWQTKELLK